MARGVKSGGRSRGTPNKITAIRDEVTEKLRKLGCDPIEGMAIIAKDPKTDIALRGRMYAELAQYVLPKRKAVEHTGQGGGPLVVKVVC